MKTSETSLGIKVVGHRLYDLIRCGVHYHTQGKIKVGGCAVSSRDTEFTYELSANGKLTKAQLLWVRTLAHGIAIGACLESSFYSDGVSL